MKPTLTQTKHSTPQRLHERGSADRALVHSILDSAVLCHIGYAIDGRPTVTPTTFWREGDAIYWHGSSASRMMRHLATGVPLCFTVSLMDALVLARSGFHHSVNYRAVMLFGQATLITDAEAKRKHLDYFIDHLYPGRNAQIRAINPKELKATALLTMTIDEGSAKVRTGGPKDDEEDMSIEVWAGLAHFNHAVVGFTPDEQSGRFGQLPQPTLMKPLRSV